MKRLIVFFGLFLSVLNCLGQSDIIEIVFIFKGDTLKYQNYIIKISDSLVFNQNNILTYQELCSINKKYENIDMRVFYKNDTLLFTDVFLSGLTFIPANHIWYFTIFDTNSVSNCIGKKLCASFFSKRGNAEYFYSK